ncbi:RNA polymerase sigma factor [Adhaeribacter soli]|uniref:Sigma-70 family RNA polymerase sigma factor n=1 Tax=Adhaeribacter soli TaxID=2607655 RepID=A0A5N1IYL2_9BACT|nr:sigma-70 family RNA polymerase sigma factor [Adhaeribacter soli]KAA9338987.1 sigma-70 family RNA polymerase sigma factor [Adhaeribacter soli]
METLVQLKLLSDIDLFITLCSAQSDNAIYEEFVKRFLPELKKECLQICKKRKLDEHLGLQIAHDTFEKARKYKSFRSDEIKTPDSRKGILIYLFRIATNLFNDHHSREKKESQVIVHKSYFDDLFCPQNGDSSPERLLRIRDTTLKIFSQLNKKEQKVVLTDLDYKKHQKYLPDDVNERLADELGVKKDTIRKIRERAINKIKKAIDEINQI